MPSLALQLPLPREFLWAGQEDGIIQMRSDDSKASVRLGQWDSQPSGIPRDQDTSFSLTQPHLIYLPLVNPAKYQLASPACLQ